MCPRLFHPSAWLETSSDAPTAITRLNFISTSPGWEAKHTCLRARLPLELENNLRRRASRRHAGVDTAKTAQCDSVVARESSPQRRLPTAFLENLIYG